MKEMQKYSEIRNFPPSLLWMKVQLDISLGSLPSYIKIRKPKRMHKSYIDFFYLCQFKYFIYWRLKLKEIKDIFKKNWYTLLELFVSISGILDSRRRWHWEKKLWRWWSYKKYVHYWLKRFKMSLHIIYFKKNMEYRHYSIWF